MSKRLPMNYSDWLEKYEDEVMAAYDKHVENDELFEMSLPGFFSDAYDTYVDSFEDLYE